MARHMMQPDPDAAGPSLGTVYAVIIFVLLVVLVVGHLNNS